jgi:hypothetical protein
MVALTFAIRLAMLDRGGPCGHILFVPALLAASLMFDRGGTGFFALGLSAALMASVMPWAHSADVHLVALMIFAPRLSAVRSRRG